jgi:hypothetical protein
LSAVRNLIFPSASCLGQVNELGECTGRTASTFATARNFRCRMGRRTGGDDRQGDVNATGKNLTRAGLVAPDAGVACGGCNRKLCGPTLPPSGPHPGSKEIRRRRALTVHLVVENRNATGRGLSPPTWIPSFPLNPSTRSLPGSYSCTCAKERLPCGCYPTRFVPTRFVPWESSRSS